MFECEIIKSIINIPNAKLAICIANNLSDVFIDNFLLNVYVVFVYMFVLAPNR